MAVFPALRWGGLATLAGFAAALSWVACVVGALALASWYCHAQAKTSSLLYYVR